MSAPTRPSPTALPDDLTTCARDVVEQIDQRGIACLESAVDPQWLARAREYGRAAASEVHEAMLAGLDEDGPSFVGELASDPRLAELFDRVATEGHPHGDQRDRRLECGVRIVSGPDALDKPLWFHYDASVVTMVIPIDIPDGEPGQSGELVLYPNRRPFRKFAAHNVAEKSITQTDAYQRRFLRKTDVTRDAEIVAFTPGNAYLFWGYRSYHATMPCPPGSTRITFIVHYRDAHFGSRLLQLAKAAYRHTRAKSS